MNFLNAAFDLTRFGFKVFPLQQGGKKPVIAGAGGGNSATDDEDTIGEWSDKYPSSNIGIRCGRESGITVIDIDVKSDAGGGESLKRLARQGFKLPKTVTVETPSGGLHFYFKHNPAVPNSVGTETKGLAPGIDIRSQNGYVVAPPSQMAGGAKYTWKRQPLGTTFPALPEWVVKACQPKTEAVVRTKPYTPRTAHEGFERELGKLRSAQKGARNVTLYNTAVYARMRAQEGLIEMGEARARIEDIGMTIGLDKSEALATINSAWRGKQ